MVDAASVRRARPADAGEVLVVQRAAYVLDAQVYGDPMIEPLVEPYEDIRAAIEDAVVLVAASADRVVGFVRGRLVGRACHLDRLAVAPDRQGLGIGSALVAAIEDEVQGLADELTAEERDRGQARVRLYERHGFEERYRDAGGPDVIHIHLHKSLAPPAPGRLAAHQRSAYGADTPGDTPRASG